MLLVLTSTAAASAEEGPYWSVAVVDSYGLPSVYGAAWNFASLQEAEEAALEECQKRADKGCHIERGGQASCFFVGRTDGHHKGSGRYTGFWVSEPYPSRAEAGAGAERRIAENYAFHQSEHSQHWSIVFTIELVECAGIE